MRRNLLAARFTAVSLTVVGVAATSRFALAAESPDATVFLQDRSFHVDSLPAGGASVTSHSPERARAIATSSLSQKFGRLGRARVGGLTCNLVFRTHPWSWFGRRLGGGRKK
jgi:hypothetical protein